MKLILLFILLTQSLVSLNLEKPKTYKNQDIRNWLMSEKLDGIRAFWDGKKLYTKNGNEIFTPKKFTNNFPNFPLDGELWTKRGDFENIQSIVLDKIPSSKWKEIKYHIFEAPFSKGNFKNRLKKVEKWFLLHPSKNIKIIEQKICKNKKDLDKYLNFVLSKNGEGIIVKNPSLPYISKRSNKSLKVKKYFDMEGIVTAINYKNGIMKSLVIKLKNNVIFNLGNGFSKEERKNSPKIGDIITFKYYGFTKNSKPKFASFLRIRKKE